ncbi:MAG: DUF3857 domain-containing protein, partial [Deltaproteobacteria bacterium]|nr:DUF3857 domain-containing protein [Deltaproteobacteria bacterium]
LSSCGTCPLANRGALDTEISKLLQPSVSTESHPDADIVHLLDEVVEEVFTDGSSTASVHKVFRIVSESGRDEAEREIGFNSRTETITLLYARTITPEGNIIGLKKNASKIMTPYSDFPEYSDYKELTFSMPGVTIGSIIDYKYVKKEKEPTIVGHFSSSHFFQRLNPVLLSRYKIIVPDNMDLKYRLLHPPKGVQLLPTVISQGGKKIYLWEYRDIPQIVDEILAPPFRDIAFKILASTLNSWEDVSRWWRKELKGKTEADNAIENKVAELTEGLSSSREKIQTIFDWVSREIRYVNVDLGKSGFEPEPAPEVFENRYGDCKDKSTLLISMLKTARIPAYYVAIPTLCMGKLVEDFPHPFQFNHCIVAVENEHAYHFLDPTAEHYRFDYLPVDIQDRGVLIVKGETTIIGKTLLQEAEDNADIKEHHIKIAADGAIEVSVNMLRSGSWEAWRRYFYAESSPTEIKESLEKNVHKISPGAKLLEYTYTDPLDFKKEFREYLKFYTPDYCKKAGDILIFQVPIKERSWYETAKEERRYPLLYIWSTYRRDDVKFNIPEGYEVYYLPEPVEIENSHLKYRASYRSEGARVFYQSEVIRKAGQIPLDEYADYRESCQAMEKSHGRCVLFSEKK